MLFVVLGEADKTADALTLVAVELDRFDRMLVTAAGDVLARSDFFLQRHYLMFFRRRLTMVIPSHRNKHIVHAKSLVRSKIFIYHEVVTNKQ